MLYSNYKKKKKTSIKRKFQKKPEVKNTLYTEKKDKKDCLLLIRNHANKDRLQWNIER